MQSPINQYKQTHETEQILENVVNEVLSHVDIGVFNMIPGEYSRQAKTVRKEERFTHNIALPHCPSSRNTNPAANWM